MSESLDTGVALHIGAVGNNMLAVVVGREGQKRIIATIDRASYEGDTITRNLFDDLAQRVATKMVEDAARESGFVVKAVTGKNEATS